MTEYAAAKLVDPVVAELAGDCARQIATNLGESPEAWRGAAEMALFIKAVVTANVEVVDDNPALGDQQITQLLTVAFLEQLPLWPADVSGEPLIVEVAPGEPRPHFREA
jgi:hypothetical protein